MKTDRMQTSRFELKYIISERKAEQIRNYVRSFLELDEYGVGKEDLSYPVHSLYVDSAEMKTYWDTINGNKNRFKLRVRYYSEEEHAPAFLEIKRRINNCIQKQRVGVRREAVKGILRGQLPPSGLVLGSEPKHIQALQNFCRIVQELRAEPKMHIAYAREAYLPRTDNAARLTMDRKVRLEPDPGGRLSTHMIKPSLVWGKAVVLELKFKDRFPNWFKDLVQTFELKQCGAAKYADGVTLLSGKKPQHQHMPPPTLDLDWSEVRLARSASARESSQNRETGNGREVPVNTQIVGGN